jgi:hypothetical protein
MRGWEILNPMVARAGGRSNMGIGVSLFLIAAGAILDFAVTVRTSGFNLNTMGVILMIVGGIGLLWSLLMWGFWNESRRGDRVVTREREYL